jgi:hypothetical protein
MPASARFSGVSASLVADLALGDPVFGPAGEDVGERALSAAVGAHDGVNFAEVDREVKPPQDLRVACGGVEVSHL